MTDKKVEVVDAEKVQTEAADRENQDRANSDTKQLQKALNTPPGGPDVKVNSPQEIKKNQESADADYRKVERDNANSGLDSSDRPGGSDGNGKQYKDERIVPQDTNAPDAGVLPDGTRIAS